LGAGQGTHQLNGRLFVQPQEEVEDAYTFISLKHLPKYLAEFSFRHNNRKQPGKMFEKILAGLHTNTTES
jgi:hypothetical protein